MSPYPKAPHILYVSVGFLSDAINTAMAGMIRVRTWDVTSKCGKTTIGSFSDDLNNHLSDYLCFICYK